jgi:proteasome lid subunit RPN8/RPN11
MTQALQQQFEIHATACAPKEAVALVLADQDRTHLKLVENVHHEPTRAFAISEGDWDQPGICSVVHSHVTTPSTPSRVDRVMCEETKVPWHIFSLKTRMWDVIVPSGYTVPLAGREFIWGVFDCFSLVRDYYRERLQIDFPNVPRPFEFWKQGLDLFSQYYEQCGFTPVKTLQKYDVLGISLGSSLPNHCALLVENGLIFHHPSGRLSCNSIYGGLWLKNTVHILRHQKFL